MTQFAELLLGHHSPDGLRSFWQHIRQQDAWKAHPYLHDYTDRELQRLVPVTVHADGAEFYRDTEYFTWSWSSSFPGMDKGDVLLHKFPVAIVRELEMTDPAAAYLVKLFHPTDPTVAWLVFSLDRLRNLGS